MQKGVLIVLLFRIELSQLQSNLVLIFSAPAEVERVAADFQSVDTKSGFTSGSCVEQEQLQSDSSSGQEETSARCLMQEQSQEQSGSWRPQSGGSQPFGLASQDDYVTAERPSVLPSSSLEPPDPHVSLQADYEDNQTAAIATWGLTAMAAVYQAGTQQGTLPKIYYVPEHNGD